jgi:hypothetical protein
LEPDGNKGSCNCIPKLNAYLICEQTFNLDYQVRSSEFSYINVKITAVKKSEVG